MSNKLGLTILAVLAVNILLTFLVESHFSKAPLHQDIDLASSTSETFDIYVPMEQTYQVKLLFNRDNKDFEYLQSIFGNMSNLDNGVPFKVEWSLKQNNKTLLTQNIISNDSCGWSQTQVYRCLGELKVKAGNYKFNININNLPKVFTSFGAQLSIHYNFKEAHTWQTAYIFWSMLFNIFAAPLIGGIIFLILIVRYARHLTNRSSVTQA